ncbi:MAG: hypothetical protein J6P93_02325 [Alphaproteobacteria bacterium]|nr:hypothetical protein [Alphaproteobacteria bacterium]
MILLRPAFRFSFSTFTAFWSVIALAMYILFAVTGILMHFPKIVFFCTGILYFAAFVRLLIAAKKAVFEVPDFLACSQSFYLKQLGIVGAFLFFLTIPICIFWLLKGPLTLIVTLPVMLPIILLFFSGYMKDFYIPSIFDDILRIVKNRKDAVLMVVFSTISFIIINALAVFILVKGLFFLDNALDFFEWYKTSYRVIFLLLASFGFYGVYTCLPPKYRADMIISFVLVIPSIILFTMAVVFVKIQFEVSLFLLAIVLLQLLWYIIFFTFMLQFASIAFVCHLMAQVCFRTSIPSERNKYKKRLPHKKVISLIKINVKNNYFHKKKNKAEEK